MMKKLLLLSALCAPGAAFAAVNDIVTTNAELLGQVVVNAGIYYFVPEDLNWTAENCPNAQWAYIVETQAGAKAMLAVALTAKMAGRTVRVVGRCGDTNGSDLYIRAEKLTIN